ncbi:4Fe-4S dicluster domain-containing protein [Deltaproteobacteria bacterium]|nr:4Fe-4S dicluster domain-containing protein [Deltaproteobacteria bacterium]
MNNKKDNLPRDNASMDRPNSIWTKAVTRRNFLVTTGIVGCSLHIGTKIWATEGDIIIENALGMIIGDPTRCSGCRRCELACSEFNDGKAQPSISRIKVGRNYNFGPLEIQKGLVRQEGRFGNHVIIQDTCRQCPHPVPCQLACPHDAIEAVPPLNARVINEDKCTGCQICLRACPWGMISFDIENDRATKCHLCGGDPECVKICPTGALRYIPWEDRTKDIQARFVVPAYINNPAGKKGTCGDCH